MKIFSGHNRRKLVAAVVAIAVAGFYFLVNPLSAKWVPQCMFLRMTGLECPGCGAQRMAHALLHGDLRSAWEYNAFLLMMLPLLAFMAWLEKKPWAKNVVKVPQSEAIVQAQGMQKSVVNVDRHGAAAEAVRTMCRKVSVLAGLPFEKKQLKRIDTH